MIRKFIAFAALSLASLVSFAFDTPYLTFRSANSFTLSASKAWDGTLQKATGNPTDDSSWSDWTGSSITAVQSDGQYYIYLRGTGNTVVNNSFTAWTLTGSDIYCEGDIETLRGYDGNAPAMAESCYKCLFQGCTALKSIPTLSFSASTIPNLSYYQMFMGCTGLEINTVGPGVEWSLPSGAVGEGIWNYDMFKDTSGSFTGNPTAGTVYYVASALPFGQMYQIGGKGTLDLSLVGFPANIDLESTVKNGAAPYTFAHVGGTLPPGLSVSGNTISGTPTTAGNYSFSLSVTDAESHVLASAPYTMQVIEPTFASTTFVDADGQSITTNCIVLSTAMTTLNQKWYVASGTLNYGTGGIKVSGDVNLVLADGAALTVQGAAKKAGVNVASGNSLTIYGQSEGTGALNASNYNSESDGQAGGAGIGGNNNESCGSITINGGTIAATGRSGGAGIGGGSNGNGGTIAINGGTVTATGVSYGAGIGGGYLGSGADVTIYGGTVTATAGSSALGYNFAPNGIGQGYNAPSKGTLTVGPTVSVKAGSTANPSEEIGRGGTITIGTQRYFFVENLGLTQVENAFAAYVNEPKLWNLSDTLDGGLPPYTFALKSGSSLPAGLGFNGTTITGKVAVANTYTFTYEATDSSATPLTLDATYTLTVTAPDPITAQTDLGTVKVGKSKSVTLSDTISGGVPPYTFAFNGAHDAAFSLSAGELTFTPSTAQTYTCAITATDVLGTAQNIAYTVVAVEAAGFTDDDPDEPETGDSVNCLTPDGTFSRTCNQVVNSSSTVTWEDSWYYVTGNVTLSAGAIVKGKVSLILCDNATLTVSGVGYPSYLAGITVTNDNALTIYAQSAGENAGSLVASAPSYCAAIGSGDGKHAGTINIYGGNITATGGFYAAAIGGGQNGNGGNLTIYGGVVNATGYFSPGIGGGNGGNGGAVVVNGGTVSASGGQYSGYPGIGANGTADQGTLTVGATVTVKAGESATLTDADIKNPNGETVISLADKYHYFYIENTGPKPLAQTTSTFAAYVDDSFEATLSGTVSGGTTPYTFVQKSGTLPTGLAFADGVISGTPTAAGSATVVFTVSDSGTGSDAQTEDFTYTITVTAKPKKITYYNGPVEITGLTPSNYVEGVGATLAATAPAATGYAFEGWYNNSGLTGNAVRTISDAATGDKEFWAKFTPVKYTISYWDGSSLMSGLAPSNYTIEAAATLPATATKAGYGFYGWYGNSALTGERVYTIPAGSTGNKSFYAKWGVIKTSETYIDGNGDSQSADCVELGSTSTTLSEDWYVVKGNVSISGKVTVSGDVKILLADDAVLTVNSSSSGPAIEVKGSNKLTIYVQSKGNGALNVTASSGPGIGSSDSSNPCGTITIYGGDVTVTGDDAGIGGGWNKPGGTVYVYGGNVIANGGSSCAGIGGSYTHLTEGSLTVGENVIVKAGTSVGSYVTKPHGVGGAITLGGEQYYKLITPKTASVSYRDLAGEEQTALCKIVSEDVNALADGWYAVTSDLNLGKLGMTVSGNVSLILADDTSLVVTGANNMAAINVPSNSSLTIYGQFGGTGAIQAVGGYHGAGIGGTNGTSSVASAGAAGTIVVNGGNITAIGGNYAAGIGGGYYGGCEAVTVNNGTVTAIAGSNYGAGIGGGYYGNGAVVTISGGTVTATGGSSGGAGIGGGNSGMGGAVTISGGTVTATGGSDGAGIGGGSYCSGAPVTISGGTVTAIGGSSAAGIGGGSGGNGDDVVVTGGSVTASGGLYSPGIGRGSLGTSRGTLTVTPAIIIVKAGASENPTAELTPDSNNQISLANDYRYFVLESTEAAPLSQVSGMLDAYAGEVTALPLAGTVSGGVPQYTFAFSGDHPEGVTLSDARTLSVAATVPAGEYTFAMTVTDSDAPARSETFTYKLTVTVKPTYYSITYMDGTTQMSGLEPTTYDVGVGTNLPVTVEKNGYSFNLWYRDIDLTDGPYSNIPSDATGDKTFYAKWTRLNYTIYYYDEDGTTQFSGLVPTSYTVESDTFTLPMPPEREGYDFVGWYANASFTGSPVTQVAKGSYGTKRFYAKWSKVVQPDEVVPVSFVDENGTAMTTNCVVLTSDNVASLSSGWYALTNSLSLNATVEIAGNVKLVLCDDQTLVVTGANYMAGIGVPLGSTLTVYAQAGGSGAISAVGATYAAGIGGRSGSISDATQGSAGTIVINGGVITATSGNDFAAGIGGGSQGNGADVTVNRGLVTATGGANAPGIGGGYSSTSNGLLKVPSTMVVKAGASANPTERLDVDSETGIVSFEGKPKYFIVKTAEGETAAHSITYMDGEAAISGLKPVTFYEGTGVATLPTPAAKTGYDFSGWYANAGFTGEPVGSIAASVVEDVTLYARYTPIEYTIAYKDGATTLTSLTPTSYTIESAAITLPTPEASGDKVFGGWYTSSTLTGDPVTTIPAGSTGDKTFYAKWEAVKVNASYIDASGTAQTAECIEIDTSSTTLETGWYVVNGDVVLNSTVTISGDVNLILANGASFVVTGTQYKAAINVTGENSLTIYGQAGGTGRLEAIAVSIAAGIGGNNSQACGTVTINGGIIVAAGNSGAGIGGGMGGNGGIVTINGGNVTALGGFRSAGIGGGYENSEGGIVRINGGIVTASSGTANVAGIGGGYGTSNNGELTVAAKVVVKAGSSSTLTDADILNPAGETEIALSSTYQYYSIERVGPEPLSQTTGALAAYVGEEASFNLAETVSGGTPAYAFALKTGTIPSGMTLSGSTIAGIPTDTGVSTLVFTVTDSGSGVDAQSEDFTYTLTVSRHSRTITYMDGEAVMSGLEPTNYLEGVGATLPASPVKSGYTFGGWYNNAGLEGDAVTTIGTEATGAKTFWSRWTEKMVNASYIGADGEVHNANAREVFSSLTELSSGWYVVTEDVTIDSTVTVSGDVNLILSDGATMTITGTVLKAGVNVASGNSLTIFGQVAGTGALTAYGNPTGSYTSGGGAGIGGNVTENCGAVTINGGVVTAIGGNSSAGIGGGVQGNGGTVIVNGGVVRAAGGEYEAGSDYAATGIGKGSGSIYTYNCGTLTVPDNMSVKAGNAANPSIELEHGAGGAITIGVQRYFVIERKRLHQEESELSAYTGEAKNWNMADTITGGVAPYTFALKSGSTLPQGLSLSGTTLSGTVAAAGEYAFTLTVTDSTPTPLSLDAEYTLNVVAPEPMTAQTALGTVRVGKAKDFNLSDTISGGVAPYTFALSSGTLPAGFTLESGVLSGTATVENEYAFTLTVTDYIGTARNFEYTLTEAGSAGFLDEDAEEPDDGVSVDCRTFDGVLRQRFCTQVTSSNEAVTWSDSWYYVTGNVTLSAGVTVCGKVSLVLADGATLTVSQSSTDNSRAGINVTNDNSIVIYGASSGTGAMTVTAANNAAGIGGDMGQSCGTVTICGGVVTARTGASAYYGAGIGGGQNGNGGTVTIYGGTVTAQAPHSGAGGAGIGSGGSNTDGNGGTGGTVTIYGGTVTATSGYYGAGIGGGKKGNGGTVTINGGTVTATSQGSGTGVGRGDSGTSDGELSVGVDVDVMAGANEGSATLLDPAASGTYKYFHFETVEVLPLVQTKSELLSYPSITLLLADTVSGGRSPLTFTGTLPEGLSLSSSGVLTGTLSLGEHAITVTVTDRKGTSRNFNYTISVVERTGFIDDDPEEPVSGVMVPCRTADGVLRPRICNQVSSSTTAVTWSDSWYYVTGDVTLTKGVKVSGKVSLILADGATLTVNGSTIAAAINVTNNNSIVIYGQEAGTGALVATTGSSGTVAGIGGNNNQSCGKVVIYGGFVTATGTSDGAGIGGGMSGAGGTVIINGGTVTATCGQNAAGIGGGGNNGGGGDVTVNGGTVNATGGSNGAGIGGGNGGAGGTVAVNGGLVNATGGSSAAGIGGGNGGAGGTVTVSGGTIRATSTHGSASSANNPTGIGKGWGSGLSMGTLTVEPGTTVKTGFSADSELTSQTPVEKVVTLGTGSDYRYYEIDGPRPLTQTETALKQAYKGAQSSWTLSDTVDGGIPPLEFTLKAGSTLPDGLSVSSGVISGVPTTPGEYEFTFVVTDSDSASIDANYTLSVVNPPELIATETILEDGVRGEGDSWNLVSLISGGVPQSGDVKYALSLKAGSSYPSGLTLYSGVLQGTPSVAGNYSFTMTARDGAQPANSIEVVFTLSIKQKYAINYYDGSTKLSPASEYTTYIEGRYKTLSYVPTKLGYDFVAWYDNAALEDDPVTRIENSDTGDKTFYAKWNERPSHAVTTFINADGTEGSEDCVILYPNSSTTLGSGWYVANSEVSFASGLTVSGTPASPTHLVLADGARLTVTQGTRDSAGISVAEGKALVIYGQSGNTGTLTVTGGKNGAAIGGASSGACGSVTINGGTVNAGGTDTTNNRGAGIGGGSNSSGDGGDGGTVVINGGNVTASSGSGAGIGGGSGGRSGTFSITYYDSGDGGTVTINGGNVTATSAGTSAGIGGGGHSFEGHAGAGGTVTINGGIVTASSANRGAGIGGGMYGSGGAVTITGGRVVATGGVLSDSVGAGIGAGNRGESQGTLTVANVTVKAGAEADPQTELVPEAGAITLSGERYYVAVDESAGVVSPITYMDGSAVLTSLSPGNYTEGTGVSLSIAVPQKEGYSFVAWYDNEGLTGAPVTAISAETTGPKTFWAKWEVVNYTISYIDGTDGVTPIAGLSPATYTIESPTITLPAPTAPEGKMFDGWYTQNDFSPADQSIIETGSSGNKTFYAKWATVTKTPITFVGAGGAEQTEQCRTLSTGITELRNGGWYVVRTALVYGQGGMTVHGVANLVLADGASLMVTGSTGRAGIAVTPGNALNIYGQSEGTGVLDAYGRGGAGIGGGSGGNGGTVTIYGGTILAASTSGAGIGGGMAGNGGEVTINGGTVVATGSMAGGAGIGGGYIGISTSGGEGGIVRINGGTVTASGGMAGAAGIGAARGVSNQGSLFTADGMTVYAGASENPGSAPVRNPATGEVMLGGEQYWTAAPTSEDTRFAIIYKNGAQTLTDVLPDSYSTGSGTNLPTSVEMVRNGATFGGWYESADFTGDAVTAIEPGTTGEKTFYAKWIASYIAMDGSEQSHDCTELTSATEGLSDGWYIVTGTVEFDSMYTVSGYANLILADGATLSVSMPSLSNSPAIEIAGGKTLTVYGQSSGTGALNAAGRGSTVSGISGTLVISSRMVAKGGVNAGSTLYNQPRDTTTGVVTLSDNHQYISVRSVESSIIYMDGSTTMTSLAPATYFEGTGTALPTAEQVVKEGYSFEGWYKTYDFSMDLQTEIPATATGTQTFYAKFDSTEPDFTIVNGKLTRINPKSHRSVTIPDNVYEIGNNVLLDLGSCFDVTNVTISSSVTNINDFAFSGSLLTSITVPGTVKSIGQQAFYNCSNLVSVAMSDGVATIKDAAFSGCTSLTSVNIPGTVAIVNQGMFSDCTNLTTVTFGEGVREILTFAFSGCSALTDITIPNGMTFIGYAAFYRCGSIVSLELPKGITISGEAFASCTGLRSVNISGEPKPKVQMMMLMSAPRVRRMFTMASVDPELTTVGERAFSDCTALEEVIIGAKVSELGEGAFAGCNNIITMQVETGNALYKSGDGMLLTKDGTKVISGYGAIKDVSVPYGVTNVMDGAFSGFTSLTNAVLPGSVTVIGAAAFSNATEFTTITIPTNVTSIAENAFYGTKLATVKVGTGETARVKGLVSGSGYSTTGVAFQEIELHVVASDVTPTEEFFSAKGKTTAKEKAEYKNTVQDNGLTVWQNYAMGITTAGKDATAADSFKPVVSRTETEGEITVATPFASATKPTDSGVTVKYVLYKKGANDAEWTPYDGTQSDSPSFNLNLNSLAGNEMYFRIKAIFTK